MKIRNLLMLGATLLTYTCISFGTSEIVKAESSWFAPDVEFSDNFDEIEWINSPFEFEASGSDLLPDSGDMDDRCYRYMLNNSGTWIKMDGAVTYSGDTKGSTLIIEAYDQKNSDNHSEAYEVNFKYDATAPIVNNPTVSGTYINVTATDATSGVLYYGLSTSMDVEPMDWSENSSFMITEAGTYYAFARDYAGNVGVSKESISVTIPVDKCTVYGINDYEYTGKMIKPDFVVTYNGNQLFKNTDYTVSYSNNKNVGTGTITIKGKGNYTGTIERTFKITKAIQNILVPYSGYTFYRSAINKNFNAKVIFGNTDDKLKYTSSNKKVFTVDLDGTVKQKGIGKATLTITSKGNENFKKTTKKILVTVAPRGLESVRTVSDGSGQIKVSWNSAPDTVDGYRIYVSTNKSFKKSKTKIYTVKKRATTSKTIKKLKKGKTYYVKICAYKKTKNATIEGQFSRVRRIVTMK